MISLQQQVVHALDELAVQVDAKSDTAFYEACRDITAQMLLSSLEFPCVLYREECTNWLEEYQALEKSSFLSIIAEDLYRSQTADVNFSQDRLVSASVSRRQRLFTGTNKTALQWLLALEEVSHV